MLAKEGVLWSKGVLSAPGVSAAAPASALEQALGAAACVSASGNGPISLVTRKAFHWSFIQESALSSCGLRSAVLIAPL